MTAKEKKRFAKKYSETNRLIKDLKFKKSYEKARHGRCPYLEKR